MLNPLASLQYPKSKLAILLLLTFNAGMYAVVDTPTTAADAGAWLMLLAMYELQTHSNGFPVSEAVLRTVRSGLIGLIALVFFSYWHDSEWLDVANSLLWFGLIAIMELEVRRPAMIFKYANLFWLLTILIFSGLIVVAGLWLWQQAWLDAYDALLWIIAFCLIEVDILQFLQRKRPPSNDASKG